MSKMSAGVARVLISDWSLTPPGLFARGLYDPDLFVPVFLLWGEGPVDSNPDRPVGVMDETHAS